MVLENKSCAFLLIRQVEDQDADGGSECIRGLLSSITITGVIYVRSKCSKYDWSRI